MMIRLLFDEKPARYGLKALGYRRASIPCGQAYALAPGSKEFGVLVLSGR